MKKILLAIVILFVLVTGSTAQNIFPSSGAAGIGTTLPNGSSLLEVNSTTKGVLLPRMTLLQRNAIVSPATGLLIYQTDNTPGYYYYYGSGWSREVTSAASRALNNLNSPTAVNQSLLPLTTGAITLGSASLGWKNLFLTNAVYLKGNIILHATGTANLFTGTNAGNTSLSGSYNTGAGSYALSHLTSGSNNTACGAYALYSDTSGIANTASGGYSLYYNTTGGANTASGSYSLSSNTIGFENTASGGYSLYHNTTGDANTATGYYSLYNNTTGNYNTASGHNSLPANTTGGANTASGFYSLFKNSTGNYNTANGYEALFNTRLSEYNTAVGCSAGYSYDNGYNNVFLGANTDVNGDGYYNVIAIGQGTIVGASSRAVFGNSATVFYGGWANWSSFSDGRYKKNIKENVPGLDFINKLRPVTYNLDATGINDFLNRNRKPDSLASAVSKLAMDKAFKEKEKIRYTGFVAQEVEKSAHELSFDFSGVDVPKNENDVYSLRYAEFVVPLVKAVQELDKKNDELTKKNDDLEERLSKLEILIIEHTLNNNSSYGNISFAYLQQNMPNPSNSNTIISYYLPDNTGRAQIKITDIKGSTIKVYNASAAQGSLNISTSELPAGTYNYTLYVNDKKIDTKQMVIMR